MSVIDLAAADVDRLFRRARLPKPAATMVLFGVRGCSPADGVGGGPAASHRLSLTTVDYRHPRCTIGYVTADGECAAYPGSTVPYGPSVEGGVRRRGRGVNQLCYGLHRGYSKALHPLSRQTRFRHRALRMDRAIPVQRTADDADFDGSDRLEFITAYDNIHCGWTDSVATPRYSSLGCQVLVGSAAPRETGPWGAFVRAVYASAQSRFDYALFSGSEVRLACATTAGRLPVALRYGSQDDAEHDDVRRVQEALTAAGHDPGAADGRFGFTTLQAVFDFQRRAMGHPAADGLVGAQTAEALGLNAWANV